MFSVLGQHLTYFIFHSFILLIHILFYASIILGSTMTTKLVLRNGIIIIIMSTAFFLQTNKQFFFPISSIVLSYNTIFEIRINHPPSHVYNVLPSQTLHNIESVFTPGPLPGVKSGLTARRLFDLAMIKLGKLESKILK